MCHNITHRSIMMERLENVMHTQFGGREYWLVSAHMYEYNLPQCLVLI